MNAQELLDVALGTERWIDGFTEKTAAGRAWGLAAERPEKYIHTLYAGSAGIVLFYLELYLATEDKRYLEVAVDAGNEILEQLPNQTPTCAAKGGWGGYMFVLNELGKLSGEDKFRQAARSCAQNQRDKAEDIGAGIGWIQEMPYAKLTGHEGVREIFDMAEGAAGAATYWLYGHNEGIHEQALDWSRLAADRLLEVAEPAEGGLRWQLMPDIPWAFDAPNFAHGTAGVSYFMARMFQETSEQKYLDAALAGAGHVQAMAEEIPGGGYLVPHILNDGKPNRYYLGECHGPAGTGRLFHLLSEITSDAAWRSWGRGLDDGMVALGAPEERGKGFWNNISQCCCDAGIGDHAVNMFRATGDEFYKDLAVRVANEVVRRAEEKEDTYCWPQAEHRTQPDFIQAQTGYMQGAAGVGSFLIHLATTLKGDPVKIQFPDSPF